MSKFCIQAVGKVVPSGSTYGRYSRVERSAQYQGAMRNPWRWACIGSSVTSELDAANKPDRRPIGS
jgi:hypothetical protein